MIFMVAILLRCPFAFRFDDFSHFPITNSRSGPGVITAADRETSCEHCSMPMNGVVDLQRKNKRNACLGRDAPQLRSATPAQQPCRIKICTMRVVFFHRVPSGRTNSSSSCSLVSVESWGALLNSTFFRPRTSTIVRIRECMPWAGKTQNCTLVDWRGD